MSNTRNPGRVICSGLLTLVVASGAAVHAQWIEFVDATTSLLEADQSLVADDLQEKDYAWGDVDKDGDVDLVIVRKEPFTTLGKEPNLLLINHDGVLTDRTAEFVSDSDVAGDNGFLTPTNDRDVVLVDVDLDGWLDIVTAPTLSLDDPKHIGHPRIYRNRGCLGGCSGTQDWLGFIHEDARIPQMLTYDGQVGYNPRLCAVSAGDVTGDGYPDLYFSDYDNGVIDQFPGPDFNDRLLINQGVLNPGHFTDVTDGRFFGDIPGFPQGFEVSVFGAANAIADLNGDDLADIIKHTALNTPYYVGFALNDGDQAGFFDSYDVTWQGAPYFVSVGDLNNDDWPELIVTEDGADRYFLNQRAGEGALAEFISYPFSFSHTGVGIPAEDDGFGSNSLAVDLDDNGWKDVLIADVDVDVPGCGRRMHVYRNLGTTPGEVPTIQEQTTGSGCANFLSIPSTCIVVGIPSDKLEGVHDVAVFDIDGDGRKDMVVGRCTGTEVYLQVPSGPPAGATPDGAEVPGPQLVLDKSSPNDEVTLTWGDSCSQDDDDYAVYAGQLDGVGDHAPLACSTAGSTTYTLVPGAGDAYYLIVPNNGITEGSYGRDSSGVPRPQGAGACYPRIEGACDG
jgi:hypothetical protein